MVDPPGGTFQLGEVADGSLVEDEMAAGCFRMRVLAAILLLAEGRNIAETGKDIRDRGSVGDLGFGLDAGLVHAGKVFVVGVALVGHEVASSVFADTKNLAPGL